MSFALSNKVDANKVFLTRKSKVTGRLDPFYYIPSVVALEEEVHKVTPYSLRDFVIRMAGGATPSTTEADVHYTDSDDGVPFIRVQNLSTTGRLNLEDCKRITRNTHETLLARSKLSGGELLVKITGVGRMAVASVVPELFEGNINQHIVAIQTNDLRTSETLAAYLNLNIAERLASRRSTGGTRPALDYSALLSIPVIFDERIPKLVRAAVKRFDEQIERSESLLKSVDRILLEELGVILPPEIPNTIQSRIFLRKFTKVTGNRFDASANWKKLSLTSKSFSSTKMTNVISINPPTNFRNIDPSELISFVPMDAISDTFGEITDRQTRPLAECLGYSTFKEKDLLWAKITPCMENGKSAVAENLVNGCGFGSTEFHVFRSTRNEVDIHFLHALLRLRIVRRHARLFFTGSSGHQRVDEDFFSRLEIPPPPIHVQQSICCKIAEMKEEARRLSKDARASLQKTWEEIEAIILGNGVRT